MRARTVHPPRSNIPPVADAGGPYNITLGHSIAFDGSGSYDADGEITLYYWQFGNGETSHKENPIYEYSEAGYYQITLRVTDDHGMASTASTVCSVNSDVPDPAPPTPPQLDDALGNLKLILTGEEDEPLESVQVVCQSGPGGIGLIFGTTDQNGVVEFSNLSSGKYKFIAFHEDYYNRTIYANLGDGSTRKKEVSMNPVSIPDPSPEPKPVPWYRVGYPLLLAIIASSIGGYYMFRKGLFPIAPQKSEKRIPKAKPTKPMPATPVLPWYPFPFVDEKGNQIHVGEWLNEIKGNQRSLCFKPSRPPSKEEAETLKLLDLELPKSGECSIYEDGAINIQISKDIAYGDILEKIGSAYHEIITK